jgi:hypothetical protein
MLGCRHDEHDGYGRTLPISDVERLFLDLDLVG